MYHTSVLLFKMNHGSLFESIHNYIDSGLSRDWHTVESMCIPSSVHVTISFFVPWCTCVELRTQYVTAPQTEIKSTQNKGIYLVCQGITNSPAPLVSLYIMIKTQKLGQLILK